MPGNDDPTSLEEQLAAAHDVEACDERVVAFDGYTMLSLGYSNRTPWDSPRELDEDELYRRIEALAAPGRRHLPLHLQPARAALRLAASTRPPSSTPTSTWCSSAGSRT